MNVCQRARRRGSALKTSHLLLGTGVAAAALMGMSSAQLAAADSGLGQTRHCNYEAAPSQGCIAVEHWESDGRLFIQPLRLNHSWSKTRVYRNGGLLRVQVKRNGYGIFVPYRNGRYLVISKTRNFEGYATAKKKFRITDA